MCVYIYIFPIQGYLYKRSCKALNKEWKKKYVTLTSDGRLTYHPSLHVGNSQLIYCCKNLYYF